MHERMGTTGATGLMGRGRWVCRGGWFVAIAACLTWVTFAQEKPAGTPVPKAAGAPATGTPTKPSTSVKPPTVPADKPADKPTTKVPAVAPKEPAPLPANPNPAARPPSVRPPKAEAPPLPEVQFESRQEFDRGVTLATLSNGMKILVQENHAAPVATVRCFIHNTGSAYEGRDIGAGLSHVLEHLVAGGTTTKRTEVQIREIIDTLGGHTNAYTSDDVTAFYIDCPGASAGVAIELIAENMQFSVIPEAEYTREMGVVQRELEMGEADRSRVLYHMLKQLVYIEHPKRHPTIGYLPVVRQIKRQEVIDFYKNRYVPENMLFVVVGDVETNAVMDDVLAGFKNFQRTTERQAVLPDEPDQPAPRSQRREMEGPSTNIAWGWPTVPLQNPDLYPLDVAAYILANGDSSRLVRKLKIEQPLTLRITSASNTPGSVKGWFEVSAECKPDDVAKIQQEVFAEIERLQAEFVTPAELAKAKRQKAADHVFSQQTVQTQADSLAESYLWTGDPLFDAHYVEGIQKVTAEQVREVARRYFLPERLNTVIIDPLGTAAGRAATKKTIEVETPITKHVLPNGLTVLLKRQTNLPIVNIQAYARAGVLADTTTTRGLASLTTEMLERGTEKYSAEQIADYFDSIGGSMNLSSQTNTSYLQSAVLTEDAATAFDYICQVLFAPTFPQAEFDNVQETRLGRIASRKANPQAEIMDFFAQQLPADNPYSRTALGETETISKLKRDDCVKFHKAYFVPANLVLSIFGDIDTEAALKMVEDRLGAVPAAPNFRWPSWPLEQTPLAEDKTAHLQNMKKNTAMVIMSFPTISVKDESERATLDLLEAILTGGGGAGGRLHEELRGEQLVYYIHGIQMIGFAPGYFTFLAQTRPESVPEVLSRVRANLAKIAEQGVPDDEFEKARRKLVTSHAMRHTTPAERAFQASVDELYGLGFEYEKSFPERIGKVTPKDVQAVAKKYFGHGVTVTSSPEGAPKAE